MSVRPGRQNYGAHPIKRSDEVWIFGPISDGVLAEIKLAKEMNKPVRYFKIAKANDIAEIGKGEVEMEADIASFKNLL
jgi:hypothetical protein